MKRVLQGCLIAAVVIWGGPDGFADDARYYEIERSPTVPTLDGRVELKLRNRLWPTGSETRLEVEATFQGQSVALEEIGDHVLWFRSPVLADGHFDFSAQVFLVSPLVGGRKLVQNLSDSFLVDGVAPTLVLTPEEGARVLISTPTLRAVYQDSASGIDPTSFRAWVDGVDLTERLTVGPDSAVLQFTTAFPLAAGTHEFRFRVADRSGLITERTVHFQVDLETPLGGFMTGVFQDDQDAPIPGAQVTSPVAPLRRSVQGVTDTEGRYRIPFEAGGRYLLHFEKVGFTTADRWVEVIPGRDSALAPVSVRTADAHVTSVSAAVGGVARNSTGTIVMTIPPGALSSDVQVSGTEFRVGESLPGSLPELSAFTFAQDISFRTATGEQATFQVPIQAQVTDDLGFAVGTRIPIGKYEPTLGEWLPIAEETLAFAEIVPTVGAGRIGTRLSFFYPSANAYDPNTPVVLPASAVVPSVANAAGSSQGAPAQAACSALNRCRLQQESGNLAEDIVLPAVTRLGQNFALAFSYNSLSARPDLLIGSEVGNRVRDGFPSRVKVRLGFGASLIEQKFSGGVYRDNSVQRVLLEAKNAEGAPLLTGSYRFSGEISAEYDDSQYASAAYFGAPPGIRLSVVARQPGTLKSELNGRVVVQNETRSFFGTGWTLQGLEKLSVDPEGTVLWMDGTGASKVFTPLGPPPSGGRRFSSAGSGGLTLVEAPDPGPISSLAELNGVLYASSCESNRIYRVNLDGQITPLAGTGERGFTGDGASALGARLSCPRGLAVERSGAVVFADSGNLRIRRVRGDGVIETVAGNGRIEAGPDGVRAKETSIGRPQAVSVDPLGVIHFTTSQDRIRSVNPYGKLETWVDRTSGYIPADLSRPAQILYDKYQSLIVVDEGNDRVVRLVPQNKETQTWLGPSTSGGRVLAEAQIRRPMQMSWDPILKRYFVLERSGKLWMWDGPGNTRAVEILSPGAGGRSRGEQRLSAMVFSPEAGLVVAQGNRIVMGVVSSSERARGRADVPVTPLVYASPTGEFSQLERRGDGTYTRTMVDGSSVLFDSSGRIASRTGVDGSAVQYQYASDGRLTRILIPPNGEPFVLEYDDRGYLARVRDPAGRETQMIVSTAGDMVAVTTPDSAIRTFAYDSLHRLMSQTDAMGRITQYRYRGGTARITAEIQPDGERFEIAPAALEGLINDIPDPTQEAPTVTVTQVRSRAQSAEGRGDEIQYDRWGNPVERTDGLGQKTGIRNNAQGLVTRIFTPEGRELLSAYDFRGRLTSQQGGASGSRVLTYDDSPAGHGQLASIQDGLERVKHFRYGATSHQVEELEDEAGEVTRVTYHPLYRRPTEIRDATGGLKHFGLDTHGNVVSMEDEKGRVRQLERDAVGNVVMERNPEGRVTRRTFDGMNRVLTETDAAGGVTWFTYFPDGRLATLTDAIGQRNSFAYTIQGDLLTETDHAGRVERQEYDSDRKLTRKIHADGTETVFTYDLAGRLIRRQGTGGNFTAYDYDRDGVLARIENEHGVVEREVNGFGQEIRERFVPNFVSNSVASLLPWVSKVWDEAGRKIESRVEFSTSGLYRPFHGLVTKAERDRRGLITRLEGLVRGGVGGVAGESSDPIILSWVRSYDPLGRRTEETAEPFGIQSQWDWNEASELMKVVYQPTRGSNAGRVSIGTGYEYSLNGNRTSLDLTLGPDATDHRNVNYSFDPLDRVIRAEGTSQGPETEIFAYDGVGNRTEQGQIYEGVNRLREDAAFRYTHDERGRLVRKDRKSGGTERWEYSWSGGDQLIFARRYSTATATDPEAEVEYKSDGLGRRVARRERRGGASASWSAWRLFIYEREDIAVEVDGSSGQLLAAYVHNPDSIDEPMAMVRDRDGNGRVTRSSELFTYAKDGLGSVRDLINVNGVTEQRYHYSTYGVPKVERRGVAGLHELTAMSVNEPLSGGDEWIESPYSYASREVDGVTGLSHNGARELDVLTGRWLSPDPIGFKGGDTNLYRYVHNRPVNRVDPSGLTSTLITTYDFGVGSHSAILVETPGQPSFLYDPAGSYPKTGSGDFTESVTLAQYVAFQKSTGSSVQTTTLNTTHAQEAAIIQRAITQGGAAPGGCASSVSGALGGACGIIGSWLPGILNNQANQSSCSNAK